MDMNILVMLHDEIILEADTRCLSRAAKLVRSSLEEVLSDSPIPFNVNLKHGKSLAELKPLQLSPLLRAADHTLPHAKKSS